MAKLPFGKALAQAGAALSRGHLHEAEDLCRHALSLSPRHEDALFLMAEICSAGGRPEQAVEHLNRAVRHSKDPAVPARLGQILIQLKRYDEAERHLKAALRLRPDYVPALGYLGLAALERKDADEAAGCFERILRLVPNDVSAWLNLGNARLAQQRPIEAKQCFERAIALDPSCHGAWNNLGDLMLAEGEIGPALDLLQRAVHIAPGDVKVWVNLSRALEKAGNWEAAEEACRRAVALLPNAREPRQQLGTLLLTMHREREAADCFTRLVRDFSDVVEGWVGLSKAMLHQALFVERGTVAGLNDRASESPVAIHAQQALTAAERALALEPKSAAAHDNRGLALGLLGRHAEAEAAFRDAIAAAPDMAAPHFDLAALLLGTGRFAAGWREYAWRTKISQHLDYLSRFPSLPPAMRATLPPDNSLAGKRVLVARDQGLGDQVFFLRFAPALKQRGAWIAYWTQPSLRPVLASARDIDLLVDQSNVPADVDLTVAVGDLPLLLGAGDQDIPPPLPLVPAAARVAEIKERLSAHGAGPVLAVTWRAGPPKKPGERAGLSKSVDPVALGRLLRAWPGVIAIVQRHPAAGEIEAFAAAAGRPVLDLTALNEDLGGMLALMSLVDDYVAVSNTNVHLRASVGGTARILVPYPAEWRWMVQGEHSPWFPEFILYREDLHRGWEPALARLAQDLKQTTN